MSSQPAITKEDIQASNRRPLLVIRSGSSAPPEYMLSLADLGPSYSIPIVFYNQLGCGRSTHIREKYGDGEFWTEDLLCDELDNLLQKLGGIFASRFAMRQPKGLNHLIVASTPTSATLWIQTAERFKANLPQNHDDAGTTSDPEYEAALHHYYIRHVVGLIFGRLNCLQSGPSEIHITGTLKNWSMIDDLHKITASVLVLNSRSDKAQDEVVEPFYRIVPRCKWLQFAESSHLPFWEEREKPTQVVADFLREI
ncbi:hypothetical protein M422DRAFT_60548 [Sphaerobolus stellatus SS14]|uniref:Uncharacterized protein n=1 Tax=Sphaerobolus stellatus (strain SS14) TaxID=990650 RepID=A0A0C9UD04_SPHS4|nr:hypothetical protein M422DRAFT_60548 [Sphaerobolus stellatus SS14]